MARKKKDKADRPISVGGQAVMEGVMMQAPDRVAIAVRQSDGKIAVRTRPLKKLSDKYKFLGWPLIRGVVNMCVQLYSGMKTLAESAEMAGKDMDEPSKFEKRAAQILHMKAEDVMMLFAVIFAVVLSVGMFFVLPISVEAWLKRVIANKFVLNLLGGLLRMALFLGYVLAISRLKEIRRVFQYHGAEHKSVHCFESGEELTVENAQKHTTLHPRCGTSFLVFVMMISILVFVFLGTNSGNVAARVGSRLLLLPLVAGLSYELLKWLARANEKNPAVRILKWPGLMTQKLTTAEPDDGMVEVALAALKAALGMEDPVAEAPEIAGTAEGAEAMAAIAEEIAEAEQP